MCLIEMPLAQIDDKGTSIYYEDSGAPDGHSRYTTVVLVHGTLINSGMFVIGFNGRVLIYTVGSYFSTDVTIRP